MTSSTVLLRTWDAPTVWKIKQSRPMLVFNLRGYSTLEECFAEVNGIKIKIVDKLFAWQLCCDLMKAQVIVLNNLADWAALGPRAGKGIVLIF